MGTVAREALQRANEYCCGLARVADPERAIVETLDDVLARTPDVLLDLTTQPASYAISLGALERGLPTVVGSSGWSAEQRAALAETAERRGVGALLVPNFSVGATLMMRFAQEAARFFPDAEIVEMHHAQKKDKPSGTARETAARIASASHRTPSTHSIRLPGIVAHHEVLFAGAGELLTIRHDSFTRESFVPGMLAAVHAVVHLHGLSVGLDSILAGAS